MSGTRTLQRNVKTLLGTGNDSQVVELEAAKYYSPDPGVHVEVVEIAEEF